MTCNHWADPPHLHIWFEFFSMWTEQLMSEDAGSVTRWLRQMKSGDSVAAQEIWGRYYSQLVRFAEQRLQENPDCAVDGEDLAHSAFRRCCAALMTGRYAELNDREDLWNLLIVYTLNRVRRHFRDSAAQKRQRGQGEVIELSGELALYDLQQPETATVMSDLLAFWMERLDAEDPTGELREIALMRMDHRTADEIARALQRRKTVVLQKIQLIRLIWEQCEQA